VTCAFTNAFTAAPPATTTTTAAPVTTTTVPSDAAAADTGANGSGQGLAMTGEDVRMPLAIALVLAASGGALLALDRVRRRRTVPVVVDRRDDRPPT